MRRNIDETFAASPADDAVNISIPDIRTIDSCMLDGSAYKGEGNATLVVSFPRERKVLRFRKSLKDAGDQTSDDGGKARAELIMDFYENVISGLLGRYASEPEIVRFDREDLSRWTRIFEEHRPELRGRRVVERFATTVPDYTMLPECLIEKIPSDEEAPTFCVEIKPKLGFSFDNEFSVCSGKCDYCRKQYTKVASGEISKPSDYCPLDLFSGKESRMRRALAGLVRSPQNNFRIFRNGKLVYGAGFPPDGIEDVLKEWVLGSETFEKEKALDTMFELIREALLRPFPQDRPCTASSNSSTISLPRDSVLEKILRAQTLNNHSVDHVHRIYSAYSEILNDEIIYKNRNSVDDNETPKSALSEEELLVLRNYLVHRIAKDCSIMMAFRAIDSSTVCSVPSENVIRISRSRCFLFNNAVTDLDPKSVHSIEKHYRQKQSELLKIVGGGQGSESVPTTETRERTNNRRSRFDNVPKVSANLYYP